MKYCPTCETRYDEEILRFCMKDGTPLLDVEEPSFIQMPSESIEEPEDDEAGEVTVVRRNVPVLPPAMPSIDDDFSDVGRPPSGQRIVVPTFEEQQQARARVIAPHQAPPRTSTLLVVALTIFGTLFVLGIGALGFWFLQNDRSAINNANANLSNANQNTNVNTNLGIDSNFNFSSNSNMNSNANVKMPTPTPKPSPSVTPSPLPTPDDDDFPSPTPNTTPSQTPRAALTPTPLSNPTPRIRPRTIITPTNQP